MIHPAAGRSKARRPVPAGADPNRTGVGARPGGRRTIAGIVLLVAIVGAALAVETPAEAAALGMESRSGAAARRPSRPEGSHRAARQASPQPGPRATPDALESLDWAFRFAAAIRTDPKDRSRAEEAVVQELAAIGALDRAVERAGEIDDWRRGTALADLAVAFALEGRSEQARSLIDKAEAVRAGVSGWQNPRIQAHVADALAALGETDRSGTIASSLAAEDKQYIGRAAAIVAVAMAAGGQVDKGMERLAALASETDFDTTYWRTEGYMDIARRKELPRSQRERALEAARVSALGIPGWQKAQSLVEVGELLQELGETERARESVQKAEEEVALLSSGMTTKAALLSNVARAWARLGRRDHAERLSKEGLEIAAGAMVTEKPALYASVASGFLAAGDAAGAARVYTLALDAAEQLQNARPRALAVVAICRSLATSGAPLDGATRDRLGKVFAGLKDPW